MKNSRDLLLLIALITACAAGAVSLWSHRQYLAQDDACDDATRQLAASERALHEATALLGQLKSRLLAIQRDEDASIGYEQWSQQQEATRTTIANLRRRLNLSTSTTKGPIAPLPALAAAAERLHDLGGRLGGQWQEFEQRGSGLTPDSQAYLSGTLLPSLVNDLTPALDEAAAAAKATTEHVTATFPHLVAPLRHIRTGANAVALVALGIGAYALATRRRGPRKLLAAAWQKSATDETTPELNGKITHSNAAPDRTAARILLAVPAEAERTTLSTLLTNAGYAVVACDRHDAAQAAVEQLTFSLIVLDAQLTGGESQSLLEAARRTHPALPVLLITSPEAPESLTSGSSTAITQAVRRPVNPRTLLWNVSEILFPEEARTPSRRSAPPFTAPGSSSAAAEESPATPVAPQPNEGMRRPLRRAARLEPTEPVAPETAQPPSPPPVSEPEPGVPPASTVPEPPRPPTALPVAEESPADAEAPATTSDSNSPIPRKRMVRRRNLPPEGS